MRSQHVNACHSAAHIVSCVQACWQKLDLLLQLCSWLLNGHAVVKLFKGHACLAFILMPFLGKRDGTVLCAIASTCAEALGFTV